MFAESHGSKVVDGSRGYVVRSDVVWSEMFVGGADYYL
jgi:hypothetical protein